MRSGNIRAYDFGRWVWGVAATILFAAVAWADPDVPEDDPRAVQAKAGQMLQHPDEAYVPIARVPRIGSLLHPDPAKVAPSVFPRIGSLKQPDPAFVPLSTDPRRIGLLHYPDAADVQVATLPRIGSLRQPEQTDAPRALTPFAFLQQPSGPFILTLPLSILKADGSHRELRRPESAQVAQIEVPLTMALVGKLNVLVSLPAGTSAATFTPLDPFAPSSAYVDLADASFEDPANRRRGRLLSPLATDNRQDRDKFIVSLARDHRNRVWIGTEDQGSGVASPLRRRTSNGADSASKTGWVMTTPMPLPVTFWGASGLAP